MAGREPPLRRRDLRDRLRGRFLQFAIVPLLPEFSDWLGLSKTQAGFIVAAYSGAVLLFSFPVGRLADRVGAAQADDLRRRPADRARSC